MDQAALSKRLIEALQECGCWSDDVRVVEVAMRRWRSFDRRTKVRRPTVEHRIEDMAKGIRDAIEPDRRMVGPIMEDYRHTASVLAAVLQTQDSKIIGS